MSAFGPAADRTRVWCNLCRAKGEEFVIYVEDGQDWLPEMQKHSFAVHADHEAALARGEKYEPVEVAA